MAKKLSYHNSFIFAAPEGAHAMETAGRHRVALNQQCQFDKGPIYFVQSPNCLSRMRSFIEVTLRAVL